MIDVTPLHDQLLVDADCTNVTAENQLMKAHLLTDAGNVNNTSTHSTDKDATFIALAIIGEVGGYKLLGRIAKLGQLQA
jgi:hypothetical protein